MPTCRQAQLDAASQAHLRWRRRLLRRLDRPLLPLQPLTRRQRLLGPALPQQLLLLLGVVRHGLRRPCSMLLLRRRRRSVAHWSFGWLHVSRAPHAIQGLATSRPVPHRPHGRRHRSKTPLCWEDGVWPGPWGRDLRRCWCRLPRLLRLPPPLSLLRSKVLLELTLLFQGVELAQLLHLL